MSQKLNFDSITKRRMSKGRRKLVENEVKRPKGRIYYLAENNKAEYNVWLKRKMMKWGRKELK